MQWLGLKEIRPELLAERYIYTITEVKFNQSSLISRYSSYIFVYVPTDVPGS